MSLNEALFKYIENAIQTYTETICEKFSLDREEVYALWTDKKPKGVKAKPEQSLATVDMDDISLERLMKCNKEELKALCKAKGCKCSGKKEELINRLLGEDEKKTTETKPVEKKVVKKTKNEASVRSTDVVKKLTSDIPVISIRRNQHGNLEHPETGLIFDKKSQTILGKQEDDGTISELTDEDIEKCKQYKFRYNVPDNLDKKGDLSEVKVDELDEKVQQEEDDDVEILEDDDDDVEVEDDETEEELEDDE